MKASLTNYRQAPRKVRLVASLVKGKNANEALFILKTLVKRAGDPLEKLLRSAIANAKDRGVATDNLIIKEFRVDKGVTLKRIMPRARGSAFPIKKRSSNVLLVLAEATPKKVKAEKAVAKK